MRSPKTNTTQMNNIINNYTFQNMAGQPIRLTRGMSKQEVISIVGSPVKVEPCKNESNEKLVFKMKTTESATTSYTILFIRKELVYIAKLK